MTYTLIRTKLQVWDMILDAPAVGHVRVVPTNSVIVDEVGNRVLSAPNTVYLDDNGWFEADLPASDDATLKPTGFAYTFEVRTKAISFDFTTQVRLADATEVTETDPVTSEVFTHWELNLGPLTPILPTAPLPQAVTLRDETVAAHDATEALRDETLGLRDDADASAVEAAGSAAAAATARDEAEGFATQVAAAYTPRAGVGFPEGQVAAPVGTEYIDTASTAGAMKWLKTSGGSTSSGWTLLSGDTGERNVASLVTPEANQITNLLFNPGFEGDDLAGWGGTAALTFDTTRKHSGTRSAQATDGNTFISTAGLTPGATYTYSAWVYIPSGTTSSGPGIRPRVGASGVASGDGPVITARDTWTRVSMTFTILPAGGNAAFYPCVGANGPVWFDDMMLTAGDGLQDYFDGNTPNGGGITYTWLGTPNDSASTKVSGAVARLRREGAFVHLYLSVGQLPNGTLPSPLKVLTLPAGFTPRVQHYGPNTYSGTAVTYAQDGSVNLFNARAGATERVHVTFTTNDNWPATVPGTPG